MKDFDTIEIRAARTMAEADYFFKQRKGIAVRQEFAESFTKRLKVAVNRILFREGRL